MINWPRLSVQFLSHSSFRNTEFSNTVKCDTAGKDILDDVLDILFNLPVDLLLYHTCPSQLKLLTMMNRITPDTKLKYCHYLLVIVFLALVLIFAVVRCINPLFSFCFQWKSYSLAIIYSGTHTPEIPPVFQTFDWTRNSSKGLNNINSALLPCEALFINSYYIQLAMTMLDIVFSYLLLWRLMRNLR